MARARSEPSSLSLPILGVTIHSMTAEQALARLEQFLVDGKPHQVATVNPEFLVLARDDADFREALLQVDLRLADGTGIILASWLLGRPLPCRHPGLDLVVALSSIAARRGESIYLLGAGPGVAQEAAAALVQRFTTLRVAGAEMGPAPGTHPTAQEEAALVARIRASRPSILMVAFGAPLQETWLARHKDALGVPIMVGVGGSFDVLSGRVPRAPRLMRRLGLEWLFRLIRMPWRWRRQLSRLPRFVGLVVRQVLQGPSAWRTGPTPIQPASPIVTAMTAAEPPLFYCSTHPSVATLLRCNKCETPICPRCLVQTPTGARCRTCARLQPSPIYQLRWSHYLRATGVGLILAIAGAVIWVLLPLRGFFTLFLGWGFGLLLAQAIGRSVNHKRGLPLQIISAASVLLAGAITLFLEGPAAFGLSDVLAVVIGIAVVVGRLA